MAATLVNGQRRTRAILIKELPQMFPTKFSVHFAKQFQRRILIGIDQLETIIANDSVVHRRVGIEYMTVYRIEECGYNIRQCTVWNSRDIRPVVRHIAPKPLNYSAQLTLISTFLFYRMEEQRQNIRQCTVKKSRLRM